MRGMGRKAKGNDLLLLAEYLELDGQVTLVAVEDNHLISTLPLYGKSLNLPQISLTLLRLKLCTEPRAHHGFLARRGIATPHRANAANQAMIDSGPPTILETLNPS